MSTDNRAPVVCMHGLGRPATDWDAVRSSLQAYGPVITPAVPRGLTEAVAILGVTAQPGSIVIGHSMGGVAALRFASITNRPLRALVLTNCAFPPSRNGRTITATAADYGAHRLAMARELVAARRTTSPRVETAQALRSFATLALDRGSFQRMLQAVTVPTLVIHTRDDHYVPVQFAIAAAGKRPDWTLNVEPKGGHHAHIQHPEAWLAAVAEWLSQTS